MRRQAFTLIELVVAIAIIAILASLTLAAAQRVRWAAARAHCGNNLRQIGLAMQHYHDAQGRLPPGITSIRPEERFPRMSWPARLLPYLEQEALWREAEAAYRIDRVPSDNPPHTGFATPLSVFSCPLDSRLDRAQPTHRGRVAALSSYVGVLGTDYEHSDGVLFRDSRVRLKDILDGTSNTLMVAERPPSTDCWYGWWYAGYGQRGTGSLDIVLGAREIKGGGSFVSGCAPGPYEFAPGNLKDQCSVFHFWSLHSGGAHFLLADGSVHFLAYSGAVLIPTLATRAGSEKAVLPE